MSYVPIDFSYTTQGTGSIWGFHTTREPFKLCIINAHFLTLETNKDFSFLLISPCQTRNFLFAVQRLQAVQVLRYDLVLIDINT